VDTTFRHQAHGMVRPSSGRMTAALNMGMAAGRHQTFVSNQQTGADSYVTRTRRYATDLMQARTPLEVRSGLSLSAASTGDSRH
jgi:hypothetical protein